MSERAFAASAQALIAAITLCALIACSAPDRKTRTNLVVPPGFLLRASAADSHDPILHSSRSTDRDIGQPEPELEPGTALHTSALARARADLSDDKKEVSNWLVKTNLREAGTGKESGLRKKMKGPGFMSSARYNNHSFAFQSGAMKAKGRYRQYFYGGESADLGGGANSGAEFASDEFGNSATALRIAKKLGDTHLRFASLENRGFESEYTGFGQKTAKSFNEVGFDWDREWGQLGVGVRDVTRMSGMEERQLQTYQVIPIGSFYITHTSEMPSDGNSLSSTAGTLSLFRYSGEVGYYVDVDYGDGTQLSPTALTLGLEVPSVGGWDLGIDAAQMFDGSYTGIDLYLVRDSGGLKVGPTLGWDTFSGSYIFFRAWLPLSRTGPLDRWGAHDDRPQLRGPDARDEWCNRTLACL